jgi:putative FmdB family regulatory protein
MPVYEYSCEKCGGKFEILRGITASNDDVKCPKCGAEKPKRVISVLCGAGHVAPNKGNLRFPT